MNSAVELIQETIDKHKKAYKGQHLLQYDHVRLPPLMIVHLEELLETYYKYKDLCK